METVDLRCFSPSEERLPCVVCLDNPRNSRLPCGHEVLCASCALTILKMKRKCPNCRKKFSKIRFSDGYGFEDYKPPTIQEKNQLLYVSTENLSDQRTEMRSVSLDCPKQSLMLEGKCALEKDFERVCGFVSQNIVTKLSLADNFLIDSDAIKLALALEKNTTLQYLNVSKNRFTLVGVSSLLKSLVSHPTLKELNLSSLHMGKKGSELVAEFLKNNKTLEKLCLYDNSIGDSGCQVLNTGLKYNQSLNLINLRCNMITATGARTLIKNLKESSLTHVDIGFNLLPMGKKGNANKTVRIRSEKVKVVVF